MHDHVSLIGDLSIENPTLDRSVTAGHDRQAGFNAMQRFWPFYPAQMWWFVLKMSKRLYFSQRHLWLYELLYRIYNTTRMSSFSFLRNVRALTALKTFRFDANFPDQYRVLTVGRVLVWMAYQSRFQINKIEIKNFMTKCRQYWQ